MAIKVLWRIRSNKQARGGRAHLTTKNNHGFLLCFASASWPARYRLTRISPRFTPFGIKETNFAITPQVQFRLWLRRDVIVADGSTTKPTKPPFLSALGYDLGEGYPS